MKILIKQRQAKGWGVIFPRGGQIWNPVAGQHCCSKFIMCNAKAERSTITIIMGGEFCYPGVLGSGLPLTVKSTSAGTQSEQSHPGRKIATLGGGPPP